MAFYTDNGVGGNGTFLQPVGLNAANGMRYNNGAPAANNDGVQKPDYDIPESAYNEGRFYPQDRVIASEQNNKTTYVTARNENYFQLSGGDNDGNTFNDNGTALGNVTATGKFQYVGPQTKATYETNDSGNNTTVVMDSNGTYADSSDDAEVSRKTQIARIFQVGTHNILSARGGSSSTN